MKIIQTTRMTRAMRAVLASTLAVIAAVSATDAFAALDMFLKLDGVPGESSDDKHAKEIDVLDWSWGVNGALPRVQKTAAQPFCAQGISLTKVVDRSTPVLLSKAAAGESIPNATLTIRRAGTTPLEFLVITFTDVRISSESTGGSGGETRLTENVTLNFGSATVTYTPQKPDGTPDTPVMSAVGGSCL
jgi:type VI secretion system secreted protein Hcp